MCCYVQAYFCSCNVVGSGKRLWPVDYSAAPPGDAKCSCSDWHAPADLAPTSNFHSSPGYTDADRDSDRDSHADCVQD
jgi:hypothetical protein